MAKSKKKGKSSKRGRPRRQPVKAGTNVGNEELAVDEVYGIRYMQGELEYLVKWLRLDEDVVENILDVRQSEDGKTEYFVKWKGYPDDENTWEPQEKILCKDKIFDFMKSNKKKVAFINQKDLDLIPDVKEEDISVAELEWIKASELDCEEEARKYKKKLEAKREIAHVYGITERNGHVEFIVKWKDNKYPLVSKLREGEIKVYHPQALIDYYESNLIIVEDENETNQLSEPNDEEAEIEPNDEEAEIEPKEADIKPKDKEGEIRPKDKEAEIKPTDEDTELKPKDEEAEIEPKDKEAEIKPKNKKKKGRGRSRKHQTIEEGGYEVENILSKRIVDGHVQYYLKWKGYRDKCSWEVPENLNCPDLIWEYEKNRVEGYRKRWNVEKVLEYIKTDFGETYYQVKWKESENKETVLSDVIKAFWWHCVIDFYETKVSYM